jgi:ubiquinone/menaquinone biosynthesis C-methylase UbiE
MDSKSQQDNRLRQKLVDRVFQLDQIHSVDQAQVSNFVAATGLHKMVEKPEIQLADLFCGNGFAICALLGELVALRVPIAIHCVDMNGELLQVAQRLIVEQLPPNCRDKFTVITHEKELDSEKLPFADEQLDFVVVKMGLHELPFESQVSLIQDAYRVLKPGGRFVIWGNLIDRDQVTGRDLIGFNEIIRKKDSLAGFGVMSNRRYFTSQEELFSSLTQAGFTAQLAFDWIRRWDSLSRLNFELDGDVEKLNELNAEIDRHFADGRLEAFEFSQTINQGGITGRSFNVRSGIILAQKPSE